MAALLTIEAANTDKLAMYLGECRDLGDPDPSAGHQLESARLHGRAGGRPLRPRRGEERRRRRHPVDARRSQGTGPHRLALHALRARGPAPGEQAACSRAWSRLARSIRSLRERRRPHSRRARLFAAIDKAIEHGGRHQRDRDQGQHQLFGGGDEEPGGRCIRAARCAGRGAKRSSSRSRRSRSVST